MTSVESGSFWKRFRSYLDDEILIKKLLLSHDPDGRRLDSEILLSAAENIMSYAYPSEEVQASEKPNEENSKSHIGDIELTRSQEPVVHTISKISHEMLCKCPGKRDLHTRTMALFEFLGNYKWDAKVALALAALATSYGEFCLLMQLRTHVPLAVSVGNFKQLPTDINKLKPQLKALRSLFKTMVDLTKCIIEFEGLPLVHVGPDIENLAAIKSEIYVTAYWIVRSALVCSSQITNLTAKKPEYSDVIISAWELLSLQYKLSSIHSRLRKLVDAFRQQIETKLQQKLVSLFKESRIDNQEVLQMLFSLKDDLPLKDCSSQEKIGVSKLKGEVVLLLISKPDLLPLEQLFFLVHQTYDHPNTKMVQGSYTIIWIPISVYEKWTDAEEKWFNFLSDSIPFYSVRQPWCLNSAVINFMRQEWKYEDEATMVVLDSAGTVTNLNALDMLFIWGSSEAYPFSISRENELWDGEHWTMQLITNEIHPILTQWVEEGRNICIYGSENLDWIREFSGKLKEIKNAGVQLEMIYVGKNNPNGHVKDTLVTISRTMHSNLLSFTELQLFWLRLESMKRSKTRTGYIHSTTDPILAEMLALMQDYDDNDGWAVFGKGMTPDVVRVKGAEIKQCLNLFEEWGENAAELEFIGSLRTVLEPHLLDGPCNHTEVVPYSQGLVKGSKVCQKCKRLMKKFTVYQ